MAEREPSWWDLVKAAFRFRPPLKRLGALPINQLMLYAGLLFAALFFFGGSPLPALGVLLLTAAAEILYLFLLSTNPQFRMIVKAEETWRQAADTRKVAEDAVRRLSRGSAQRFQKLVAALNEIDGLLESRQDSTAAPWRDALQTGGLEEIRAMFGRLLEHRERTLAHLASKSVQDLPKEIRDLREELRSPKLADAVRRSKEQTLVVLEKRAEQLRQMRQNAELAESELQRLEQHLALLRDQAAASDDTVQLAAEIDGVVSGVTDTADWLLESERMLADPLVEDVSVDA